MGKTLLVVAVTALVPATLDAQPFDEGFRLPDVEAQQGDWVGIPVAYDNLSGDDVTMLLFMVTHDPALVTPLNVVPGSDALAIGVELFSPVIDAASGFAFAEMVTDFYPPFEDQAFPPGIDYEVAVIEYEIVAAGPVLALLEFEPIATPGANIYTFDDGSILIGEITLLRGDADDDGSVNGFADTVFLLAYQFQGGSAPPCLEAADFDGDGTVQGIIDAIYMLEYQFLNGPPPPPPFPACALDPDPGANVGCVSSSCP